MARRSSSAFHSGAADNFQSAFFEIDTGGAMASGGDGALVGDVSTLADRALGPDAQDWLDHRLASVLERRDRSVLTYVPRDPHRCNMTHDNGWP